MAGGRLDEIMAQARAMVADGAGATSYHAGLVVRGECRGFLTGWSSMPSPDLASRITFLIVYSFAATRSHRRPIRREKFQARSGGPCDVEVVQDRDHFYVGREEAVIQIVRSWLTSVCAVTVE
jgi:hypothetical protein